MSLFRGKLLSLSCGVAGAAGLAVALTMGAPASAHRHDAPAPAQHVLLLSVDGLHQSDLEYYVKQAPVLRAGQAYARGSRVHRRAHTRALGLVPGDGRVR